MRVFLKISVAVLILGAVVALVVYDRTAGPTAVVNAAVTSQSSPTPKPDGVDQQSFAAGFSVFIGAEAGDREYPAKTAALLDRLVKLHVNSVAIVYSIYQDGWTGSTVRTDPVSTPSDAGLRIFVRAAHARGLSVTLRPTLDEANITLSDHWRGQIAPTNVNLWFSTYGDLISHYASFADAEGVSTMSVGVEFESMEGYTDQWKALIARVRTIFHGHVTYSYNFKTQDLGFAADLDFVGVDAYYPLDVSTGATVDQIITAWAPSIVALKELETKTGKRIVLTEVGIRSQTNAFREPFKGHDGEAASQPDQKNYFSGLCNVISTAETSVGGTRIFATPAQTGALVTTVAQGALVRLTGLAENIDGATWLPVIDDATGKAGFALQSDLGGRAIFAGSFIWYATIGSLASDPTNDQDYTVFGKLAEPVITQCYGDRLGAR